MRKLIVVISILFCFLLLGGAAAGAYLWTYEPPVDPPIDQKVIWSMVQEWRSNQEFKQYRENELLCKYAAIRVEQVKTDWSHDLFFSAAAQSIQEENPSFIQIGENLSDGISNASTLLHAWLNSPSHRENLDAPFTDSCIRCSDNNCVQLFAR